MPQHFVPEAPQEQNLLGRRRSVREPSHKSTRGPWWRALRLCVLAILTPCFLVAGPLYLRYRVYHATMYPLGVSDMRMINAHVSTTWCQSQLVNSNTTFNAYVVSGSPGVMLEPQKVSMSRQLILEDDMKEYWAFYLLRDSVVTVSTCVRWQGASLIIIKGHRHLRECAYIGDDSSEEADEVQEELEASARNLTASDETNQTNNTPDMMRRFRPGISFHGPLEHRSSKEQLTPGGSSSSEEDTILASTLLRKATEHARLRVKANSHRGVPRAGTAAPATSREVFDEILKKIQDLGPRGANVLHKLNQQIELSGDPTAKSVETPGEGAGVGQEGPRRHLGVPGVKHIEMSGDPAVKSVETPGAGAGLEGPRRRRGVPGVAVKRRREISLNTPSLRDVLNTHNEGDDTAIEEDLEPDGLADHHRKLNQTTAGDHSNSEVWSSFSSSEEALLKCAGLVLNLPLQPHRSCEAHRGLDEHAFAALRNTITYKVPSNGYYFFVFSSENEIQPNYISVQFDLEKTVYDVSRPVAACRNATGSCSLPLGFWTYDTVILELPADTNASLWNEEFFASSECQPRTAIYLACIIAVPLLIIIFAFH